MNATRFELPKSGDESPHSKTELLRALGPGTAVAIVVGYVIGAGIFLKPGNIAADVGDFRIIIAAWVAGGVLCLLGALSVAELAAMLPRSGGLYVYLREAYGPLVAFLFGWNDVFFMRPAGLAALATASVGSLLKVLEIEAGGLTRAILAAGLVICVAVVNILGVVWGGRVQNATTLIKAGSLVVLALLPFLLMELGGSAWSAANYATTVSPAVGESIATRFGVALLAVMWAYNSWHNVTQVADEIRDPQRNIPLALFSGVGILIVLYVSVNIAYHGVLPMDRMAAARDHAAEEVVRTLIGPIGSALVSAVIMISSLGAMNANLLVTPRIAFAMGRDGVFFRQLGQVHPRFRTPATAIVVQAIMGSALLIGSGVLVEFVAAFRGKSIFAMLTDFVIFAASLFYTLGVLSVIVLRFKHPEWARPYRTWGYPLVPTAFVAGYVWFLTHVYLGKPFEANTGLMFIGLGILVFFACQAWVAHQPTAKVNV